MVKTAWKPDIKRGPPRCHRQGLPPPLTTAGLVYPPPPFNNNPVQDLINPKVLPCDQNCESESSINRFFVLFSYKKEDIAF